MHDLTLAGMYADHLALMHEGSVVAFGPAADVLRPQTLAEFYGVRVSSTTSQTAQSSSSQGASPSTTESVCWLPQGA